MTLSAATILRRSTVRIIERYCPGCHHHWPLQWYPRATDGSRPRLCLQCIVIPRDPWGKRIKPKKPKPPREPWEVQRQLGPHSQLQRKNLQLKAEWLKIEGSCHIREVKYLGVLCGYIYQDDIDHWRTEDGRVFSTQRAAAWSTVIIAADQNDGWKTLVMAERAREK